MPDLNDMPVFADEMERDSRLHKDNELLRGEINRLRKQAALRDAVVEAAREVPTDHVLGILSDLMVDAVYADKWAWYQSLFDQITAFEVAIDALEAGAAAGGEGSNDTA